VSAKAAILPGAVGRRAAANAMTWWGLSGISCGGERVNLG
jgi:hypothetical protein